jgi:glycine/D-amino acid oxidase-like deaminating enzyme
MTDIEADLAVVGCGAIGAVCAYEAQRRGLRVVMVDAQIPAAGTSGNCNGSIVSATKTPGLMMELTLASKALFPEMLAALERDMGGRPDMGYSANGGYLMCEDKETADAAHSHAEAVRSVGTEITFVDGHKLHELEPELSRDIYGAFYVPTEGNINPWAWTRALVEGALALGARGLWWAKPQGFDIEGKNIRAMHTARGTVRAQHYLFSAGVWSRPLGNMVGVDIPVIPRRGELVVTTRGGALTRRKLISAQYLKVKRDADAVKQADDPTVRLGYGFSLGTTAQGQTMMGSTRAFVGYNARSTPDGVATIVREASKRIPALKHTRLLRAFAAFRPYVPDGKPIVGQSERVANLLVAAGHEGDGICLSPVTGSLIADLAQGRKPAYNIAPLAPDRFGPAKPEASWHWDGTL